MTTRLTRPIRREVQIDGVTYTVVLSGEGVRVLRKGFRKGVAMSWRRMLAAGEAHAGDPAERPPPGTPRIPSGT